MSCLILANLLLLYMYVYVWPQYDMVFDQLIVHFAKRSHSQYKAQKVQMYPLSKHQLKFFKYYFWCLKTVVLDVYVWHPCVRHWQNHMHCWQCHAFTLYRNHSSFVHLICKHRNEAHPYVKVPYRLHACFALFSRCCNGDLCNAASSYIIRCRLYRILP